MRGTDKGDTRRLYRTQVEATTPQDLLSNIQRENILALAQRRALSLVHADSGYLAQLTGIDGHHEVVMGNHRVIHPIEQRYLLLTAVANLLLLEVEEAQIAEHIEFACAFAQASHSPASNHASRAFMTFVAWAHQAIEHRLTAWSQRAPAPLVKHLGYIRWLERTTGIPSDTSFEDDLTRLSQRSTEDRCRRLDARYVWCTRYANRTDAPHGAGRIQQTEWQMADSTSPGQTLSPSHENYQQLQLLETRLIRGEMSAIGGADYATQRFPKTVLDAAVSGRVHVVVFNGDTEAAHAYVHHRFGSTPEGTPRSGTEIGLEGIDGSAPRFFIRFDNGTCILLVVGRGESRQLHLAGGILLYQSQDGARIPSSQIELAWDGRDIVADMRTDIEATLQQDLLRNQQLQIQGISVCSTTPTQLLILQNPDHLENAVSGLRWTTIAHHGVVPFRIGYAKLNHDRLVRFIIPKVGGNGLYGDTAGNFVEAVFTARIPHLSAHIVFNGTAGGFSGTEPSFSKRHVRGLGDVAPGGLLAPIGTVRQHGKSNLPIPSLFREADLPMALMRTLGIHIHLTDHHVAVKAPAIETFALIDSFVQQGFASVDVEGGAIVSAIDRLGRSDITFTPIYTHSDDPRESRYVRWDSLALMGPFFEGARPTPGLWSLVGALLQMTCATKSRSTVAASSR